MGFRIDLDHQERRRETYFDVFFFRRFWPLTLPKSDRRRTFYANLEQKNIIFEAFGNFGLENDIKNPFPVDLGETRAQKSRKDT